MAYSTYRPPSGGTNKTGYKRKDLDKLIFRTDGGASAEKIRKDPKMAGTRKQNLLFAAKSMAGKMVRNAMVDVAELGHSFLSGKMLALCGSIMEMELSPPDGKPSIIFSHGLPLLQGYNLNLQNVFDSILSTPVQFTLTRELHQATVLLPPLIPGLNLRNQWNQPYFRFKLNLGIIRDIAFDGVAYKPITEDVQEHTVLVETDWASMADKYPAQQFELKYSDAIFDDHCHLLLAIGIEFGGVRKGGIVGIKDAGCGKILGVI